MKKTFKILIILFAIFVVTGCNKESEVTTIDISKTSSIIDNKLDNMKEVEKEELEDVYGLDLSNIQEYIIKENEDGDMYIILKTDNITSTKAEIDEYLEKVKDFNQAYSPERLKIFDNRLEKEIGNYLIYIIAEDSDDIYEDIVASL